MSISGEMRTYTMFTLLLCASLVSDFRGADVRSPLKVPKMCAIPWKCVTLSQQASLLFNKKVAVREQRPLNYPVRIIKGVQDSDWDAVWKNVGLVQNTYTAFAEQLATRDMLVVEDLDEAAVPSS